MPGRMAVSSSAAFGGAVLWCAVRLICMAGMAGMAVAADPAADPAAAARTGTQAGGAPSEPSEPSARAAGLPTLSALEAAGATIGEIRVSALDIFDTSEPGEDRWLFRLANRLHAATRPSVIRRALLFRPGERVSVQKIEETERVLRANRYLYDVQIRPVAVRDGVVDIEVATRDTWTLDLGLSASRQGGATSRGLELTDYNLLGTGVTLGIGRSRDVDRTSNVFRFENARAFGTLASVSLTHAANSDGRSDAWSVARPFYRLDARWAAGVEATRDDTVEAVYERGLVTSRYRRWLRHAEVWGGLSRGLVDGWVRRASIGLSDHDERYALDPGSVAPPVLPAAQRLVAPFVRLELLEERFERELNRNLIGRPEFFALGLAATAQFGWAAPGLGSSDAALLHALTIARGFEFTESETLTATARLAGQVVDGRARRQVLGARAQYYRRQNPRWLFYASAAADHVHRPELPDLLPLGGDNGLRGYPLRYQTGARRVLITVEERFYTDLFVWQLFRLGGAAYMDVGRAWGGPLAAGADAPWLGNLGVGLRIVNARSAFSNVLHVDLALPLNAQAGVKRLQWLVKTRTSF